MKALFAKKGFIRSISCCACILLASCASGKLVRSYGDTAQPLSPKITSLKDLGGMPLPDQGEINTGASDGVFTPGEWMAINGAHLQSGTEVLINGTPVPKQGYCDNGAVLIRVPRGLTPCQPVSLIVRNSAGEASATFKVRSYLVTADLNGTAVQLTPTGNNVEQLLSGDSTELELARARAQALSPDGSLLVIATGPDYESPTKGLNNKIHLIHMGAKNHPKIITEYSPEKIRMITAITFLNDHTVAVLGPQTLTMVNVSDPANPANAGSIEISSTAATDETTLPQLMNDIVPLSGNRLALLDALSNRILVVSYKNNALTIDADYIVPESGDLPYCVDIAADPDDPDGIILLQGPNLRVSSEKITRYIKSIIDSEKKKETLTSGKVSSRVMKLRISSSGILQTGIKPLPEKFFPLYIFASANDVQYISGVNEDVFNFDGAALSLDGIKKAAVTMKNTAQLGRIIRINGNENPETVVKGVAVYFTIDRIGEHSIVYSTIRAGFKVIPPSVTAEWGVEIKDGDYRKIKRLGIPALIPPYSFPVFIAQ